MARQGTILVTGAAGTHGGTGSYLVAALMMRGESVRAMVRVDDERARKLRATGADVVVGDFLKIASMRKAMEGVDRVFFCYPLAGGLLQATANLCVVARETDVRAIANVSIMLAAPDQPSPIARDHWLSENIFDWAGVKPVHLRGAFFFENILRFARAGIREETRFFCRSVLATQSSRGWDRRILPIFRRPFSPIRKRTSGRHTTSLARQSCR